ncbi:MAG: ABC transporter substrate-binding protein [Acidimicrobiales bacterium]|nr:ABC transporter substrate-binding protein [Acidimicrobiales bacterium]
MTEIVGSSRPRRLLGGYAPLVVAVVALAAVVVVFPSRAPEKEDAADVSTGIEGESATGWGDTVTACPDGGRQVPDDPYSPPCFAFEGDNGGATSQGVTADSITVTYRQTAEVNTLALLAQLMEIPFDETSEDLQRTMAGLVDYFNENFQFYGRQIDLEVYGGAGLLTAELTGGGQEAARTDALKAGSELHAFADVTATSQPYAEALVQQDVVAFGAPYMSRRWFTDRRPYAWSIVSDCSVVAETGSTYGMRRLFNRPAIYAGGALQDEERRLAIIAPNNPEYQRCASDGLAVLDDNGIEPTLVTDYVLDLARITEQAASISAQLVSNDITTISCFCDPFMVMNLTQQIDAQGLQPEWVVAGVGFVDLDLIGQGLQKKTDQWTRAFGASPLPEQLPPSESPGYQAYTSVRDDEPSVMVDVLYYQLYQLALGIQMAGPDLTPETMETGLFSYPEATGPAGTWDYFPESYTPTVDIREVWWDPEATSPFNGEKGTYVTSGERIRPADLADGQPEVFGR